MAGRERIAWKVGRTAWDFYWILFPVENTAIAPLEFVYAHARNPAQHIVNMYACHHLKDANWWK